VRAPGITYRFIRQIDTAGPTFELVSRDLNAAASATEVTTTLTGVPKNKILVLSNVSVIALPGATFSCIAIQLAGFTGAGARLLIQQERFAVDADETKTLNWQGEIWLPGRGGTDISVEVEGTFTSGAASNSIFIGLFGIIIPRGNASQF